MTYAPSDEKCLGLSFDGTLVQAALVEEKRGKLLIKKLIPDVKPLDIEELQNLSKQNLIISSFPAQDLLVRRLRVKLTRQKDIDEAFSFQAEPLLPFPIEQAVLDKIVAEKEERGVLLTLFAAKKERVQNHLQFLQELKLDPEVVTVEPLALTAFVAACTNDRSVHFIIALQNSCTICIVAKAGKIIASHTINQGVDSEISSNLEKRDELTRAIQWNYLSLVKETRIKETPSLCLIGEGATILDLEEHLRKTLEIPSLSLTSFDPNYPLEELQPYANAIGTALTGFAKFEDKINLRKEDLSYTTPWKRFKKPLMLYAGLSLFLSFALFMFGMSYYHYKENQLKRQFISLLSLIQKPYTEFEKLYELKSHSNQDQLPITALTASEINERIDFLEKELRSMPDTFPLLPNTPRVSDVLAWLSTHPALKCQEEVGAQCPPFLIDSFNYTFVKRPELNKKNEKYQVKVDLEFSTSSPRIAREFHDALIAPNDFIDPKGEIKWNATRGKYRTSFYLKDKTYYPAPLESSFLKES